MTTLGTQPRNGLSPATSLSVKMAGSNHAAVSSVCELIIARAVHLSGRIREKDGFVSGDDLMASLGVTEDEQSEATQWVHEQLYANAPVTLRTLRLAKGLSQTRMAQLMNSTQPYISRIESGAENITWDIGRRLASVLDVDMNTIDTALSNQHGR
ncbi:helix-turn-helix transcriptional regulator [Dyella marensis]|uniref:helix-turn-helix domain-containing protein n=1 Tax=Dyella marensis TaxID=500610 RepID=UPI0031DA1908